MRYMKKHSTIKIAIAITVATLFLSLVKCVYADDYDGELSGFIADYKRVVDVSIELAKNSLSYDAQEKIKRIFAADKFLAKVLFTKVDDKEFYLHVAEIFTLFKRKARSVYCGA